MAKLDPPNQPPNLPNPIEKKIRETKRTKREFDESNLNESINALTSFRKGVSQQVYQFYKYKYGGDVIDTLKNDDLSGTGKALAAAGGALAVAPAYADLVRIVVPVPAIQAAASVAAIIGDFVTFKKDKKSRDILREKQITRDELHRKFGEYHISDSTLFRYQHYIGSQSAIYDALYEYRKSTMTDTRLPPIEKKNRIAVLNHIIESLNKEEDISKDLIKLEELKGDLNGRIAEVNKFRKKQGNFENMVHKVEDVVDLIKKYESGRKRFNNDKTLHKDLKKIMKAYHDKHQKIYSQDLPITSKNMMLKLSEKESVSTEDVSLLKASIENHFLNLTNKKQIALQDADLNKWIASTVLSTNDKKKLEDFYQQPRKILDEYAQIRENIQNDVTLSIETKKMYQGLIDLEIQKSTLLFTMGPTHEMAGMDDEIESYLKASGDYAKISNQVLKLKEVKNEFDSIFKSPSLKKMNDVDDVMKLKHSILMHRSTTAVQYSQEALGQFESPKIGPTKALKAKVVAPDTIKDLEFKIMNSVIEKIVGDSAFSKLRKNEQKKAVEAMVTEELLKRLLGESGLERYKMEQQSVKAHHEISEELKNYYETHFETANEIMSGIYDKDHLETSTLIRKGVMFTDLGLFGISLLGTIIMPAAPVAAAIGVGTSVAALGVGATNIALNTMDTRNDAKKDEFKQAILPSGDEERAMHRKAARRQEEEFGHIFDSVKKSITPMRQTKKLKDSDNISQNDQRSNAKKEPKPRPQDAKSLKKPR